MSITALRIVDDYASPAECDAILATIAAYRRADEPPLIDRPERGRSLRYRVIAGDVIEHRFRDLEGLYLRTGAVVGELSGTALAPIDDRVAGINVNITPPGGEYRWHYDRNEVTAILYLNEVEGGVTEIYANHRIVLPSRLGAAQAALDSVVASRAIRAIVGKKTIVEPKAGRLVVMRGDRCLHSVSAVTGSHERVNICMAYDRLGVHHRSRNALDTYLYTQQTVTGRDPNYRN
jgi:hypothetical protein